VIDVRNRRILVVDDNAAIHDDFRKILVDPSESQDALAGARAAFFDDEPAVATEKSTYEIDSAYQGEEALEKVARPRAAARPTRSCSSTCACLPAGTASRRWRASSRPTRASRP
jgi:CheY-like chemotaxis protein